MRDLSKNDLLRKAGVLLIISLISALNLTACGKVNEIDRHPVDVVVDTGTSSDKDAAVVVSVGTKMIDDTKSPELLPDIDEEESETDESQNNNMTASKDNNELEIIYSRYTEQLVNDYNVIRYIERWASDYCRRRGYQEIHAVRVQSSDSYSGFDKIKDNFTDDTRRTVGGYGNVAGSYVPIFYQSTHDGALSKMSVITPDGYCYTECHSQDGCLIITRTKADYDIAEEFLTTDVYEYMHNKEAGEDGDAM